MLGLAPSEEDKILIELVNNSYKNIRVVGRGTIRIDPHEVRNSPEFIEACKKAKLIVKNQ